MRSYITIYCKWLMLFFYILSLTTTAQAHNTIMPSRTTQSLILSGENSTSITNAHVYNYAPVPTQVKVIVDPAGWVQTISICNTSSHAIPLKNVSFTFNWTGNLTAIWGQPWLAWQVATHQGNQYVLNGGTTWATDLQPDPNCQRPIVLQFTSDPATAAPTGPFEFKAEGAQPVGNGTMNIQVAAAPVAGLADPKIKVTGMGATYEQVVRWGQSWQLTKLAPGSYVVSGNNIDNGSAFYKFNNATVNVVDQQTTTVPVDYVAVPTTNVGVTLVNASGALQVTFTGNQYSFTKQITNGMTVPLPSDSYRVTASVPGSSIVVTPNPLVVPTNTTLTITIQNANLNSTFGGYFQSWSSRWASDAAKTDLANLPNYVTHVYISFAKPDASYVKSSLNYRSVGLEFNYESGRVLKDAIALLHSRNPNTKIFLSVGGAAYNNWPNFNPQAIADFVADFGFDGVDLDYEAANPGCSLGSDRLMHCRIDNDYQTIVHSIRTALPRPYIIVATSYSIAAYGQDQWANSSPQGEYTGMMLPFFRSAFANDIDFVNVMSYDASDAYNPIEALAAYSHYFPRPISMGVEVPPEAWGGHVYTLSKVHELTQAVISSATKRRTPPGMMLWSLHKAPNGTPSASNPSAQMMATAICQDLRLPNCNSPLFP